MAFFCRKLLVLLWKCQLLRRRNCILSLFELFIPLAIFYLLSLVKNDISFAVETGISGNYGQFFIQLSDWNLAYAPSNNVTDGIIANFVRRIERPNAVITIHAKQQEEDVEGWLKERRANATNESLLTLLNPVMGIIFSEIDPKINRYVYKIRTNDPQMITNKQDDEKMRSSVYSMSSMFLGTQVIIEQELLKIAGVRGEKQWDFGFLPSPMAVASLKSITIFVILIFAYVLIVVSVLKDVVDEKECGTKELMKVMGVDSWMIWAHWFIYTVLIQIPVVVGCTFILSVWEPVWVNAGGLIIFLLFLLFTVNMTVLLFVVSCLFHRTSVALTICLLSWFILNLILANVVIKNPYKLTFFFQLLSSVFPVVNLCWALTSLVSFHSKGVQWSWDLLFTVGFTEFNISVGVLIFISFLSIILFTLILMYLDAVFPGPFGVGKPLTCLCQWFANILRKKISLSNLAIQHEMKENFEPIGDNSEVGIALRGLHKTYGLRRKAVAVENVDLDIYKGEIMALLGHNGAGKTTTMFMITGMTAPSRGVIMFEGEDVTLYKGIFRDNLGFCPQNNLYFSKLSVIEHLMFFGMLKGLGYFNSKESGKRLLYRLNMLDKVNTMGAKLSGGMKRRLSLAISLVGDPKVLVLDEPTSGLDPQTRRLVWDIILGMRGERTVLITTHFMEEADVLGDRIAIMDHGRVVCCGTSMFLKRLFGAGYQVHVLKKPKVSLNAISNVISEHISTFRFRVISDSQVDYIIKEEHVRRFPDLFSALERQKNNLGVTGITVTCATMEDVFLKVAEIHIGDLSKQDDNAKSLSTSVDKKDFERLEGWNLFFQQVKALFEKRIIFRLRHIVSLITKTAIILLIVLFLTFLTQIATKKLEEQKELLINLDLYPGKSVLLAYDEENKDIGDVVGNRGNSKTGRIKTFPSVPDLENYLKKESTNNSYGYIKNILFSLIFAKDNIYIRYHSSVNVHSAAVAINLLSNSILQNYTKGSGMIQVTNHPFSHADKEGSCNELLSVPLMRDIFVIYPYLFVFSIYFIILFGDFLLFITEDRVTGFKHQQFLAGVSLPVYWFVNMIFDFFVYSVVTFILLIVFSIFGPKTTFTHTELFGLLLLVFFLQGWSGLSFTYMYTLFFDTPGSSLTLYYVFMIFLGMFPALLIGTGVLLELDIISFGINLLIVNLLSLNPVFAATMCLRYIIRAIVFEENCIVCQKKECPTNLSDVLKMPTEDDYTGILLYLIYLILTSLFYPLLVLILDSGLVGRIFLSIKNSEPDFSSSPDTDDDVKLEVLKVENLKYEDIEMPLRVESLEKRYMCGPSAVDKVSFVVKEGDCFGILGVNGAGKSTVFKMITAELLPDKGDANINSYSLKRDRRDYISSVGYCPQFDAIIPALTGKEILSIIAKIRGVPSKEVENTVTQWLNWMVIITHGGKRSSTYSGGTKRKLSTAMALIGSPEVVFLDEPTTGVDPASRRMLWTVIKEMQKKGLTVVLTSHSMEECEVLCSRLTILVAGKMKCIGSVEYLKTKFGEGFTVLLKLINATPEEVTNLKQNFGSVFPNNYIKDEHGILINYTIPDPNISLSIIFSNLLELKKVHNILEDFAVSNTTLEELFLSFASDTQKKEK